MAFTLTLLGTDTFFLPYNDEHAKAAGYKKAETLSYISSLIRGENHKEYDYSTRKNVNDFSLIGFPPIKYQNDKISVIDGPTTLGSEVGARIALGVREILRAIARGETHINMMAHSRGAVEAILVAHELQRIKELCEKGNLDPEEWANSVDQKYTKKAMQKENIFEELDFKAIKNNIPNLQLHMFNIDPVPGGNFRGITHLSSLAWRDPRFYELPAIVTEYEQCLYENERTRCFKPVIPKCTSSKTSFKLFSLPGHHGTGSGNVNSQVGTPVPKEINARATDVQKLMILKTLDFLERNEVEFTPRKVEQKEKQERKKIDPFISLTAPLFSKGKLLRNTLSDLYLEVYGKIVKNINAYKYFNETAYAVLGPESDISDRTIHNEAHTNTYLATRLPPLENKNFLNAEHGEIFLKKKLGLMGEESLVDLIRNSTEQIIRILSKGKEGYIDSNQDLSQSYIARDYIKDPDLQKQFFAALDTLIAKVSSSFLLGEFADPSRGSAGVYEEVQNTFAKLNEYAKANPKDELAQNILKQFNTRLEETLKHRYKSLGQQIDAWDEKQRGNKFLTELNDSLAKLAKEHDAINSENIDDVLFTVSSYLNNLSETINSLKEENLPASDIRQHLIELSEKMAQFNEKDDYKIYASHPNFQQAYLMLQIAIDESYNYEPESIVKEGETLDKALQSFEYDLQNLFVLNSNDDFQKQCHKWRRHSQGMREDIQDYFTTTSNIIDNKSEPTMIRDELQNLAANYEMQLREEIDAYEKQIKTLEDKISHYSQKEDSYTYEKQALEDKFTVEKEDLISQKDALKSEIESFSANQEQMELEIKIKNQALANIENKLKKLNTEEQVKCTHLIEQDLKPQTKDYLIHLINQAHQENGKKFHLNKKISDKELFQFLELNSFNNEKEELKSKLVTVRGLYQNLNDLEHPPKNRIEHFFEDLEANHKSIAQHRAGKRYIAKVVSLVLVTGILPGLMYLSINFIASKFGKTPSIWDSKGEQFFKKTTALNTQDEKNIDDEGNEIKRKNLPSGS